MTQPGLQAFCRLSRSPSGQSTGPGILAPAGLLSPDKHPLQQVGCRSSCSLEPPYLARRRSKSVTRAPPSSSITSGQTVFRI